MRGYDYGSMIYYYLLTILVSNLVTPTEDEWQIAADIREGQINSFLTKPMNYLGYRFSIFLSGRLVYTASRSCPIAAIFFYFRRFIVLPTRPHDLALRVRFARDVGLHPVFPHLRPLDDGVLDPGNLDHRFHRLQLRIFPRRPDVSARYHAAGGPGGDEMAALLLRALLPDRDLPRTPRGPEMWGALAIQCGWLLAMWAAANRGCGNAGSAITRPSAASSFPLRESALLPRFAAPWT